MCMISTLNGNRKIDISIVVPVYNEEKNVAVLHGEIVHIFTHSKASYEIIFVDDGSSDETINELKKLRPIKIICFRKNFGQTAAMDAGIKSALGDIIITMDADGQNDPADIPRLLEKIDEGFDVVSGWRWERKDGFWKRFISRGAFILRRILILDVIHDSGCSLKAYKKHALADIDLYGEMHRFIPALLEQRGYRVTEVKVNHRSRKFGKSKYTFSRTLKGFLDIFSIWFWGKYSSRPLHLFGGIGLFLSVSGTALLGGLFILRFTGIILLRDSIWPLAAFFCVLVGIQLLAAGLLADILVKNYYKTANMSPYSIREVIAHE